MEAYAHLDLVEYSLTLLKQECGNWKWFAASWHWSPSSDPRQRRFSNKTNKLQKELAP